jgi:isoquinoline 1-oxidoreductase alpha subunit
MPSYSLTVNGNAYSVEAKPDLPLVWALRDLLGRGVVRIGCGRGNCGACTVRLNGEIIHSCSIPVEQADGAVITTPGWKPPQA